MRSQRRNLTLRSFAALFAAAAFLGATSASAFGNGANVLVEFAPAEQRIPFPNNLLFEADSNTAEEIDGTLNAPVADPDDSSAAVVQALNTLDGFSTTGTWRMAFTGAVDADTLVAGETVRVFEMETSGENYPERVRSTQVERELIPGEDFQIEYDPDNYALFIKPAKPLGYDRTYTAVVAAGVLDTEGEPVGTPLAFSIARGQSYLHECDDPDRSDFATIQCPTNDAIEPILDDPDIDLGRIDMLLAWGITTQRVDATFASAANFVQNDGIKQLFSEDVAECQSVICLVNLDEATGEEAPRTPGGNARILPGSIRLPYLNAPASDLAIGGPDNDFHPTPAQDDAALHQNWECAEGPCNADSVRGQASGEALVREVQTAPVVMAVPDPGVSGVPDPGSNGYPVVIFQHAIQQDRSNALAIADRLAREGYAVVGIDMPLHGLVEHNIENPDLTDLYAPNFNRRLYDSAITSSCWIFCDGDIVWARAMRDALPTLWERTQYLDLVNAEGDPVSDGVIDGSGEHFLNPAQPLTQRDNLRQGALDLVTLAHHLRNGDISECGTRLFKDGFAGPDCGKNAALGEINTSDLHFVGHSVGNIVAAPFLSWDTEIGSVAMLNPVGGIMRALEGSATVGPQLLEGLAESGVEPGTEDFYRFMASVQTAIDSVEPLNHAPGIANTGLGTRAVYLAQILGNDGAQSNPADLVLPVAVEGRPLAGSTPLAAALGLNLAPTAADHPGTGSLELGQGYRDGGALQAAVGFRFGSHASALQPLTEDDDPRGGEGATFPIPRGVEVHQEIQNQLADFLATGGSGLTIGDVTLVEGRDQP